MAKRRSISKKLRFDVFKRDSFTCQYCGSHPPSVTLEVDHIMAVSNNGTNDIDNLITSCFDCNRGKRNHPLDSIPESITKKGKHIKEREDQIKGYYRIMDLTRKRVDEEVNEVSDIYSKFNERYELNEKFKQSSVRHFIEKLGKYEVIDAMYLACNRIDDSDKSIAYFCGICWNKIRGYERI